MNKRKKIIHAIPSKGKKYERVFKGKKFVLYVKEQNKDIKYEVNGKIYNSPSSAAFAVTNNHTNGWKFWKID